MSNSKFEWRFTPSKAFKSNGLFELSEETFSENLPLPSRLSECVHPDVCGTCESDIILISNVNTPLHNINIRGCHLHPVTGGR